MIADNDPDEQEKIVKFWMTKTEQRTISGMSDVGSTKRAVPPEQTALSSSALVCASRGEADGSP
ncbi:hypothetical protein [Nocardia vinacea]|uniref:hypothetical protein n=1 Tax=Nocardia vinacea TaxID=96468 RepID=UPI00146B9F37|nr:hypothetical protein [Nocardia vinacea]